MSKSHNRVESSVQALYVGPSPATGAHYYSLNNPTAKVAEDPGSSGYNLIKELYRVQSINFGENITRVDVRQFGERSAIDRVILESPTVPVSFSYLVANAWNESGMGFHTQGLYNVLSGIAAKTDDDKNYFIKVSEEGIDTLGDVRSNVNNYTIGVGNAYITSYTTQGAINSFPTADVSLEALNITFDTGISGVIPAIIPVNGNRMTGYRYTIPSGKSSEGTGFLDISVLRPGDITVTIKQRNAPDEGNLANATSAYSTAGASIDDAHLQSYNISMNLNREQITALGQRFAHSREIRWPVDVTCRLDGISTRYITGTLSDIVNCDDSYDITVNLRNPVCPGDTQYVIVRHQLKNAKLNSFNYTSPLGGNQTFSAEFSTQVDDSKSTVKGYWISGISSATAL